MEPPGVQLCSALLVAVCVGVAFVKHDALQEYVTSESWLDYLVDPSVLLAGVGALAILISFSGFVGALRENLFCLRTVYQCLSLPHCTASIESLPSRDSRMFCTRDSFSNCVLQFSRALSGLVVLQVLFLVLGVLLIIEGPRNWIADKWSTFEVWLKARL